MNTRICLFLMLASCIVLSSCHYRVRPCQAGSPSPPELIDSQCVVSPIFDCVGTNGESTYAVFGYHNSTMVQKTIPPGPANSFLPMPTDRGQPTTFLPGTHHGAFVLPLSDEVVTWALGTTTAVSNSSISCVQTCPDGGVLIDGACYTILHILQSNVSPADFNLLPESRAFLKYIRTVRKNQRIMSGQQEFETDNRSNVEGYVGEGPSFSGGIHVRTGEWPAIRGFAIVEDPTLFPSSSTVDVAIEGYVEHGIIPVFSLLFASPAHNVKKECTVEKVFADPDHACRAEQQLGSIASALTPGTEENVNMLATLDDAAAKIASLRDRRIPVLWRPLLEANASHAWYFPDFHINTCTSDAAAEPLSTSFSFPLYPCNTDAGCSVHPGVPYCRGFRPKLNSAEDFKNLWRFIFDYFVHTKHLDNVIWVFSLNWEPVEGSYLYPGDAYVDVVGVDSYGASDISNQCHNEAEASAARRTAQYDRLLASYDELTSPDYGGKPFACTENDFIPDPDQLAADGRGVAWFMTWAWPCLGCNLYPIEAAMLEDLYARPRVITAKELPQSLFEFDGDWSTNLSLFRPSDKTWHVRDVFGADTTATFGSAGDVPVPGDYELDNRADLAVYRRRVPLSEWHVLRLGVDTITSFGGPADLPVPGDYDGNGKTNMAVYFEQSSANKWEIKTASTIQTVFFGVPGDLPVPADYSGDGVTDIAVYRPADGTWHVRSPDGFDGIVAFGVPGDEPVPGDYDGDGKTNFAVYRQGSWHIANSMGLDEITAFGVAGDRPVPADYDGDGRTDIAVYRPSDGTWHILNWYSGLDEIFAFGISGDIPMMHAYQWQNLALGGLATQSSTNFEGLASRAMDGGTDGTYENNSVTHTSSGPEEWWDIDLGAIGFIQNVQIWNRTDECCAGRLDGFDVFISDVPFASTNRSATRLQPGVSFTTWGLGGTPTNVPVNRTGRYIRVQLTSSTGQYLSLAEVQVWGRAPVGRP